MVEEKAEKNVHEHKEASEAKTVTLKKSTLWGAGAFVLLVLLVISVFTGGFGITGNANTGNTNTGGAVNLDFLTSNPDLYFSIGPDNAKVTVIEFADFQCIWCALVSGLPSWATPSTTSPIALQMISGSGDALGSMGKVEDLAEQGKIRFIYAPVSFFGAESTYAAEAGFCANDQGKFWEMHDAIYKASGTDPTENDGKYNKEKLITIAKSISGLDQSKFADCLNQNSNLAKVQEATVNAQKSGLVSGTPAVFVNGQSVNPSWTALQAAINAA